MRPQLRVPFAVLVALVFSIAPEISGAPKTDAIDADVWTLAARARAASGLSQSMPVYEMWNRWDEDDPIAIASTLKALSEDASLAPTTRALALGFGAAAKQRLGDVATARAMATQAGFVSRWLVLGPFDHEGRGGFAPELQPENDRLQKLSLATSYDGKDHRPVHWRNLPAEASPFGVVDLAATVRPSTATCVYATTHVAGPDAKKNEKPKAIDAALFVGASGSVRIYWNGDRVLEDKAERGLTFDRLATAVTIAPGWNRLLVKVCGIDRFPMFALRVTDTKGAPLEGVRIDPDARLGEAIAKKIEKPAVPKPVVEEKPKPKPGKLEPLPPAPTSTAKAVEPKPGKLEPLPAKDKEKEKPPTITAPISVGAPKSLFQELTERAKSEKATAADYHALANYLHESSGDDPTRREARDLARRAADMEPTIPRLLLAGELAEDRNQRRTFVEKAVALAAKNADVLHAQGLLAAAGPDPDSALPFFDAALKVDADHLPATLARIDVLSAAGLRRTARKECEKALGVRPRTRSLLRRLATLLAYDSPADSEEVDSRHDQLSMTDGDYLHERLSSAVHARDLAAAKLVIARWRSVDPTGSEPIKEGAGALEKLGDSTGSVALFLAALELAPDDPGIMVGLADVEGRRGKRDEQLRLYKLVLARYPQATAIRDYLEHAQPSKPREDEAYAEAPAAFLARRERPSDGFDRRILSQVTVTTVSPSGLSSKFNQIVYQPMTKASAKELERYAFGFQADIETVTLRAAKVYRKNGKIDEAADTGETRNDDPSINMYTSGRVYYVALPTLEPGDVVELRYRIEDTTPRNAFGDYFGDVTYLQNPEPTFRIDYVLRAPKGKALTVGQPSIKTISFSDEEKGDLHVLRWTAKDIPGRIAEPSMAPWAEHLAHAHVSTYKDWDSLAKWYWGLVKDQYVADDAVRAKIKELTKGLTDDRAKVRAIYGWVVQQTRYVALEFGIHGFKPYRCAQIFARGFGDCKDKSTLIVTMLRELGIDAVPVLVRTNMRGDFETSPPSLAIFDHMIAYVPSLDLYLDGTAEDHGSTELPAGDRNALALRVHEGKAQIVHLPDPKPSDSTRSLAFEVDFKADMSATIDASYESTGFLAPSLRARYRTAGNASARFDADMPGDLRGVEWSSVTPSALDDIEKVPSLKAKGKSSTVGRVEGKRRSLPVSTATALVATFAALSDRKMDVRVWSTQTADSRFVYKFPAGVTVDRAPEAKKGSSKFGSYSLEVDVQKGVIKTHARFELAVTRVTPLEYPAFRNFLREAENVLAQRLILVQGGP